VPGGQVDPTIAVMARVGFHVGGRVVGLAGDDVMMLIVQAPAALSKHDTTRVSAPQLRVALDAGLDRLSTVSLTSSKSR